jgi:hypothetical protein
MHDLRCAVPMLVNYCGFTAAAVASFTRAETSFP